MINKVSNSHYVSIGGFEVDESGYGLTVCCTLDNLLKGAATQAIQNLNDACNLDQLTGCLLYTSPSPRDVEESRMPSSA